MKLNMKRSIFIIALILIPLSVLFAQIPTDGLIAEWLFEDNITDTKPLGTPYNLNIVKGETSYLSGRVGKALYLNGATKINNTDQNLVTFINNKNPWTISFWFKYEGSLIPYNMGHKHLISIDQNLHDQPYKRIWIQTGDVIGCQMANNNYGTDVNVLSNHNIDDDNWYHATIIHDSTTMSMYVDNVLQQEVLPINLGTEPLEAFVIGSCSQSDWPTRDFYDGYIDQVRIYNRALSEIEIDKLYSENIYYKTIYDTIITEVFDTTFIVVQNTLYKTIYDTTFITVQDTITREVFDTTFVTITILDTLSITDMLVINAVLTDIDSPDNINTLKIYPNPSKEFIYINTGDYNKMLGYQLKIINQLGVAVFETNIEDQVYEVNLSSWTGMGLYYVQVIDLGGNIINITKIILQ
jgi:hypothetical protein